MLRHLPDGGVMLDQVDWEWVVNVYGNNLAILEPQQQPLPASWTPNHLDVPACSLWVEAMHCMAGALCCLLVMHNGINLNISYGAACNAT